MHNAKGKILKAKVVATPSQKTVIVTVESIWRHALYKKAVKRTRRFAVHNNSIEVKIGDTVIIHETKPMSRTKHFVISEKLL